MFLATISQSTSNDYGMLFLGALLFIFVFIVFPISYAIDEEKTKNQKREKYRRRREDAYRFRQAQIQEWKCARTEFEELRLTPEFKAWREEQYRCQDKKCAWCKKPIQCYSQYTHVDHIKPLYHGGTNDYQNLVLSCSYCNRRKGDWRTGWTGEPFEIARHHANKKPDWIRPNKCAYKESLETIDRKKAVAKQNVATRSQAIKMENGLSLASSPITNHGVKRRRPRQTSRKELDAYEGIWVKCIPLSQPGGRFRAVAIRAEAYQKLRQTPIYKKWRYEQFECQFGKCGICGKPMDRRHALPKHIEAHCDHDTSYSSNLVLAHPKCSRGKDASTETHPHWIKENPHSKEVDKKAWEILQDVRQNYPDEARINLIKPPQSITELDGDEPSPVTSRSNPHELVLKESEIPVNMRSDYLQERLALAIGNKQQPKTHTMTSTDISKPPSAQDTVIKPYGEMKRGYLDETQRNLTNMQADGK